MLIIIIIIIIIIEVLQVRCTCSVRSDIPVSAAPEYQILGPTIHTSFSSHKRSSIATENQEALPPTP